MIIDEFRLDGKVALVTGSRRGLGRAAAIALAQAGADVAVLDRGDPGDTVTAVQELGRRTFVGRADLATASADEIHSVIAEVQQHLGGVDILINNAGMIRRHPAVDYPAGEWDEVINVDLNAVFHLSQAAGRQMLTRGWGRIINIASMLSFQGGRFVPAYTAAKHGVAGLTKALANEWAADGVTVNAIAPGYLATDNTQALRDDADREQSIRSRIPAGRWGTPQDLAGAIVFLASPAAAYVTGAVLPVDGGWLAS